MWQRVKVFVGCFGFWLAYFWAARALFLGYHHAQAGGLSWTDLMLTFLRGSRLDASGAAYLTAIPALLIVLSAFRPAIGIVKRVEWLWPALVIVIGSFMIAADLELFRQWDRRIDGAVLAYLATPAEAWASTGGTPRMLLVTLALLLSAVAIAGYWRWVKPAWDGLVPVHPVASVPLLLLTGLLVVPARGGLQTVPVSTSSAYFSTTAFANYAAQNALWGFFDSITHGVNDRTNHYLAVDSAVARETVESALHREGTVPPPLSVPRPNILLIIWESASARAFGSLGGVSGVTPAFDSLAHDGVLFRRFYAAGDRTDKGLASALSGFPGLPKGSILMVPSKTRSLPKVSVDLAAAGYHTSFYYGGELEFASMQAYLVEAGFDRVIGKQAFPRSSWNSKWGAHDGVVADRLLADLDGEKAPFFGVWLTLSSHEPFETPEAPRIKGGDWQSLYFNSIAYTDHVIGELIAKARTKPWWNRTVVIIVADHGRRVVPLDRDAPLHDGDAVFRIPMLWLGGALAARDSTVDAIGSQLDIAPTLLDLAGVSDSGRYRWSHSLLTRVATPFAYYGFEVGFGLVTERGRFVFDHRAGRIASRAGAPTAADERLGRSLLQLTYQDYLDR